MKHVRLTPLAFALLALSGCSGNPEISPPEPITLKIDLIRIEDELTEAIKQLYGDLPTAEYSLAFGPPIGESVVVMQHTPGDVAYTTDTSERSMLIEFNQYYAGGGVIIGIKREKDRIIVLKRETEEGGEDYPGGCTEWRQLDSFYLSEKAEVVFGNIGPERASPLRC